MPNVWGLKLVAAKQTHFMPIGASCRCSWLRESAGTNRVQRLWKSQDIHCALRTSQELRRRVTHRFNFRRCWCSVRSPRQMTYLRFASTGRSSRTMEGTYEMQGFHEPTQHLSQCFSRPIESAAGEAGAQVVNGPSVVGIRIVPIAVHDGFVDVPVLAPLRHRSSRRVRTPTMCVVAVFVQV